MRFNQRMGWSALSAVAADAARSVAVLEFGDSYGLGFVTGQRGQIITALSVIAGERSVRAELGDGRRIEVTRASAVDLRRDLAVLASAVPNGVPLELGGQRLAEDGSEVLAFGLSADTRRLRWAKGQIECVQVLGSALTVYQLKGDFPPDAPGGPLLSASGECLGLITVAQTERGVTPLGIPSRYLAELLPQSQPLPLTSLSPRQAKRNVPQHPLNILDGSTPRGLEQIVVAIASAIRTGAPAYNQGDAATCYQVYADAARKLVQSRTDCPGPRRALLTGLERAATLSDADSQAWVMRDTFDGLLAVIERFFRSSAAPGAGGSSKANKPDLPN